MHNNYFRFRSLPFIIIIIVVMHLLCYIGTTTMIIIIIGTLINRQIYLSCLVLENDVYLCVRVSFYLVFLRVIICCNKSFIDHIQITCLFFFRFYGNVQLFRYRRKAATKQLTFVIYSRLGIMTLIYFQFSKKWVSYT